MTPAPHFRGTAARTGLLLFMLVGVPPVLAGTVRVPAGTDVSVWTELLERHVDDQGLVAYDAWRSSPDDLRKLDGYLAGFAPTDSPLESGDGEIAALINAYNAFTIRWILENNPTESIRELDESWKKPRWNIGGKLVSLDEIEHQNLRPLYGWKVHAAIVCAARSCPPLLREAYTAGNLAALTERAWRGWLARKDLNQFNQAAGVARVSQIFKWFKSDFSADGEIGALLERFGPDRHRAFLAGRDYKLEYLDYHWGLNDQSGRGSDYSESVWKKLF